MNFFLTMTDNVSSQNIDLSSWITLYCPLRNAAFLYELQMCSHNTRVVSFMFPRASLLLACVNWVHYLVKKSANACVCLFQLDGPRAQVSGP
jgi:hypothetical protein